jgi:homocysteine S-methyltransferase
MPLYRHALPQLGDKIFLTDGGLETTLVFLEGVDLPCFAAFPLVQVEAGRERLRGYFRPYVETAAKAGAGFILSTPTWRDNADWGEKLGYSAEVLAAIIRDSIAMLAELREVWASADTPIVLEGVVGPRGDGYRIDARMSAEEAERYHAAQIEAFRDSEADMVGAYTLTYPEEAIGVARAAATAGMPVAISFTVETDGRLPSGDTIRAAIEEVDAATQGAPAYYLINCAHPLHFEDAIASGGAWLGRIRGIRANASTMSHAELDAMTELDSGDPRDLGLRYRGLRRRLSGLSVMGGCCGTDHRHVAAICEACVEPPARSRPHAMRPSHPAAA